MFVPFLALPVPNIRQYEAAASAVVKVSGDSNNPVFSQLDQALLEEDTELRLFGKPELHGARRMGVTLALAETTDTARQKAANAAAKIMVDC